MQNAGLSDRSLLYLRIKAGKDAVQEQERLLSAGISFAVDTIFSGKRELDLKKGA
ncbi:MAG: hypothetical protein M1313_09995 [Nitrospirae bacterium]|nr:hypothetical protein [Nitrospirota bacterium]